MPEVSSKEYYYMLLQLSGKGNITERRATEADLYSLNLRGKNLRRCLLIISDPTAMTLVAYSRGGTRDDSPHPEFGVGDANANCISQIFVMYVQNTSYRPSKYAKICFQLGLCPGPRVLTSLRSTLYSRLERGHLSPIPYLPIPHSAPTHLRRSPCVP